MNQKATKAKIQFPLQLQMMRDEPVIDDSFNKVEKINTPYLNDTLSPVWIQNTESVGIYDVDGNRYEINKDSFLTRNGENVFQVENKKFVKKDVTERLNRFHDYDITDAYEAYSIWNGSTNKFSITFNDITSETSQIYVEGSIISSRIKIIDNIAFFVIYYDEDNIGFIKVARIDVDGNLKEWDFEIRSDNSGASTTNYPNICWYRQVNRYSATEFGHQNFYALYPLNTKPLIQIAKVFNNIYGISLISNYGKALNTSNNGFITLFFEGDDWYQYNRKDVDDLNLIDNSATPFSSTTATESTITYTMKVRVTQSFNTKSIQTACVSKDGSTFYEYEEEGVLGEEIDFPTTYLPSTIVGTVEIDGEEYSLYNYGYDLSTTTVKFNTGGDNASHYFSMTNDRTGEIVETEPTESFESIYTFTFRRYRGQLTDPRTFSEIKLYWRDNTFDMTQSSQSFELEETVDVQAGWLVIPNIVLDNGSLYSLWGINSVYATNNTWNGSMTVGNIIEESGYITDWSVEDSKATFKISATEGITVQTPWAIVRSNSYMIGQNFYGDTVRLNNSLATTPYQLATSSSAKEGNDSTYLEYLNTSASDLRYYPGTVEDSGFNYFGYGYYDGDFTQGPDEDRLPFVVAGFRVPVKNADRFLLGSTATPFNILYNCTLDNTILPMGISYSNGIDDMGTLLTPWTSIDEDFYIAASHTKVIYRDKSDRYYEISIEEGNDLIALLDDRYILVNTTSYWNMYDSVLMKKFHYATDYNDRVLFGQTEIPDDVLPGAVNGTAEKFTRLHATAINAGYTIMPRYALSSFLMPVVTSMRITVGKEKPFRCHEEDSSDTQAIDIYYGTIGGTAAYYKYSIYPYYSYNQVIAFDLVNTSYALSSAQLSPNIFTQYVNGAGNNDIVKEDYSTYTLQYNDSQPFFTYKLTSETSAKNGDDIYFFVIQGQFYAFMNEKIYSMIYSSGTISQQEAICDCKGMKFIGNNPQIAFFFSPRNRSIYSWTGDALLQHLYNANKFTRVGYEGNTQRSWYDETTQSIYVDTDKGLLVFGPQNYYLFENFQNTTNCQFSNDAITHITTEIDGERTTLNLRYYEEEGYEVLPIDLETSFYGLGNNEYTSIDRWDIVLYDNTGKKENSYITAGVRSITDVTVKSEEKTFKITPDMYDKWSNSVLIRYVPKLQKGQGIRLYIKTPLIIQRIVPHIADMNTGTLTRRGM